MSITLDLADRPTFLGEPQKWIRGTYTETGDDRHGVQLEDGTWLSVQPQGIYQSRPSPDGSYETFTLDADVNVLWVQPRDVRYAIPVREA